MARSRFCVSYPSVPMANAASTDATPPAVAARASFKKPAAPKAKPAAAPPSSDATYSRVMKRPSIKRRLASTEQPQDEAVPKRTNTRPVSHKRGAQSSSSHTEDEDEAEELVEATAPTLVADAQNASAGGEGTK